MELYEYDGFNRLKWANVNGEEISYNYRADGLRNSKETSAGKTTHLWDGANIVADLNGGVLAARYVRGIGLLMSDSSAGQRFYLYNGHGDVVQLANTSGAVVKSYDYDAFGVERNSDVSDTNVWRYCGEYFDKETGTVYLRARYYSPVIGRFLTQDTHWHPGNMIYGDKPVRNNNYNDPLGLDAYTYIPNIYAIKQSTNLYVYSTSNPIKYKDSSGDALETALDIVSFTWSLHDMINDPSWVNAGFLLWDAGALLLPLVPGSYVVKGIKAIDIIANATKSGLKLTHAQKAMITISMGEKLTNPMKDALRAAARSIMAPTKEMALKSGMKFDAVHHIIPLEWAHLFPGKNPNELSNLAGVSSKIHNEINAIWKKFKSSYPNPTALQVMDKVNEINKLYSSQFIRR